MPKNPNIDIVIFGKYITFNKIIIQYYQLFYYPEKLHKLACLLHNSAKANKIFRFYTNYDILIA